MKTLNKILPAPVFVEDKNKAVDLGSVSAALFCPKISAGGAVLRSAAEYLDKRLAAYGVSEDGGYPIGISVSAADPRFEEKGRAEGYCLSVAPSGCEVVGYDEAGAYYGAVTLAKLFFTENGRLFLPECFILDYPAFDKRGHFMECRYGSDFMTLSDWERAVDYLSETKINTLVLGLYGCWNRQYDAWFAEYQYIPFRRHPELNTPRQIKYYSPSAGQWIIRRDVLPEMYVSDYFGELVRYAKTRNITVIPLFNSLGHNTLIPRCHPEVSAQDENGNLNGVGLCTNNEKTYALMFELYDEIIERYLKPNGIDSFHIGLDEVMDVVGADENDLHLPKSPMCKCPACRDRNYGEMMLEYIIKITKYMVSKGIRNVYVYHDMLLHYDLLNEKTVQLLKDNGVYDNVIIDWWSYSDNPEQLFGGQTEKVNGLFRSIGKPITGYYNWCCMMESADNLELIKNLAVEHEFEGVIAYSSFDYGYDFNYRLLAQYGWNPEGADGSEALKRYVYSVFADDPAGALRAIETANGFMTGGRENLVMFLFGYYVSSYLYKDVEYPQDYPANQFKKIASDEKKYLTYLRETYVKARFVYDYFSEHNAAPEGRQWQFAASVYMLTCDEFLTVYTMTEAYNSGRIRKEELLSELRRLTAFSDKVLALCEQVRFEANRFVIMRNLSVSRQFVCDLRDFAEKHDDKISLESFDSYLSELSRFLR